VIGVSVLGSTGSIGQSTLDVIGRHPEQYRVVALTANRDIETMALQCQRFRPALAAMADAEAAGSLAARLAATMKDSAPQVLTGESGLIDAAEHGDADYVMAAIVGAAGLLPTLAAVRQGKRILLANKEALVVSGQLFTDAVRRHGAELLPIDSEHNAIFQCLPDRSSRDLHGDGVRRILLTASGGPFRTLPAERLADVTPEQACAHPNWEMGRKISVDSATLMNKGLEVIEAHWLFEAPPQVIDVVVHPQSVIHSMVEYCDGSVLAQLGNPDMRTPIAHALAWPNRIESGVGSLDLFRVARLDFEPPHPERFPCLGLAYRAIEAGGAAPAVLNAANEVAVQAFLTRRLSFDRIPRLIAAVLEAFGAPTVEGVEHLLEVDAEVRTLAEQRLQQGVF
jgi:1-deoxy-D-xylulose-5-phosphate reductoisomerase